MKGPVEGAGLPLYLCTSTELEGVSCKYFQTRQHLKFSNVSVRNTMKESSRETYDLELARQLWEVSEKLTGLAASP
jgi:hypothetical protein